MTIPNTRTSLYNLDEKFILDMLEEPAEQEVEIKLTPKPIIYKYKTPLTDKRKTNPRTEKQQEAFIKIQEIRQVKRNERATDKATAKAIKEEATKQQKDEEVRKLEDQILKKAISIKKREIRNQLLLDQISDDDEPIETIRRKIIKLNNKKSIPIPIPEEPRDRYTVKFI